MGVPYLYLNLYKKFKKTKDLVVRNTDLPHSRGDRKLYFDFNSLIHPCANIVCESTENSETIEQDIINFVIAFTKNIIKSLTVDFSDVLIFADGLAPFGKILQQKERRFRSVFLKLQNSETSLFDNTQISPGTNFMKRLEKNLRNDTSLRDCHIDFSKGEAEHKILKHIKDNDIQSEIFIYGLDADLIILSLLTDYNISLIRQKRIMPTFNVSDMEFEVLDVKILKRAIIAEYKIKNPELFFDNLVFITFLLGNDFIKHVPFLVMDDLSNILYICANINEFIYHDERLNLQMFTRVLNEIDKLIRLSTHKRTKTINAVEYTNNNWLKHSCPEWVWVYKTDYVNYPNKFYKDKYYLYYGIKPCKITDLCQKFLSNMVWNFVYYKLNSEPQEYTFHELECAPLLRDFINNLPNCHVEKQPYKSFINTEQAQLKFILPSKEIIESPKYPNVILDGYNCEWLWETRLV